MGTFFKKNEILMGINPSYKDTRWTGIRCDENSVFKGVCI
jgi:hypothetical protein